MTEPTSTSSEEYVLGELLGSGLTSDLYLGQYGEGGVTVLIKRIRLLNVDPARLNRLRWQMLWVGAARYPGVAWMRALLEDEDGRPLLVLQRAGEETLEQFLRRNDWGLATSAALDLVRRLAVALKQAGELGLDYTFIQPPIIMLEGGADPILLGFDLAGDFNLAELAADAPPEQVALLAPEQRSGLISDERSLVYSLGALLAKLIAPAWLVGQREDRVSAETETLLQTAMAEDPQARYADLDAFLEDLDTAIAREDPVAGAEKAAAILPATGGGWKPTRGRTASLTPLESRLFAVPAQPALATQARPATGEAQPASGTAPAPAAHGRGRASRLPLLYLLLALIAAGAILLTLEPDLLASRRQGGMVEDGALPPIPTLSNLGIAATPLATYTPEPPRVEAIRSTAIATRTPMPETATATSQPSPTPSPTRSTATATAAASPSPSATIIPPSPTAAIVLPPPPTVPPAPPPPTEPPPPPPPPTEPPPPPPTEPPPTPTAPVP